MFRDSKSAPEDNPMTEMARIWANLLGVKKVEPDDNFFALGGHSLLAVKLIAAVQEKTGFAGELKLSDLFEFPTLAAFCEHLQTLQTQGADWDDI